MKFGLVAGALVALRAVTAAGTACTCPAGSGISCPGAECDASTFCPQGSNPWGGLPVAGHCQQRLLVRRDCYGSDVCQPGLSCQYSGNLELCWPSASIVELAQSVPSLSTFMTAVVAGDLVHILSLPGPFTVFAPTNEGFRKLPSGTVESLLKPENKAQLVDTIMHHVLQGSFFQSQDRSVDSFNSFQVVKTLEGRYLEVLLNDEYNELTVRPRTKGYDPSRPHTRTVTAADNMASNGVIHIMDGVMLPSWSDSPIPVPATVV